MNRDEFVDIMGAMIEMYPGRFEKLGDLAMQMWFECLSDLDYEKTREAVKNHVKLNKYPPTVADIREQYGLIEKQNKHSVDSIKAIFADIRRYYPADRDDKEEAEKVFINEVMGKENCLDYAMEVKNTVLDYVSRCEQGICEMDMTLSERIRWAVS